MSAAAPLPPAPRPRGLLVPLCDECKLAYDECDCVVLDGGDLDDDEDDADAAGRLAP